MTELFKNEYFRVVDQLYDDKSLLVVCFANAASTGFHGVDFGQKFLAKNEISGVFVHAAQATWFQHDSFKEAILRVKKVALDFRKVILHGASMGAYIALETSQDWDVDHVIVFGPVSNIDPAKPPFEKRFLDQFEQVKSCRSITTLSAKKYSVIYDPCDFDLRHVKALNFPVDRTSFYRIFGASHRPQLVLREIGILSAFTGSLIYNGNVQTELFERAKSAKRESEYYWISLFRRNLRARPRVARYAVNRLEEMGAKSRKIPRWRRMTERAIRNRYSKPTVS